MEREVIMIIVKAKFVSNFKLRIGTSSVEMPLIKTNSYPKTPIGDTTRNLKNNLINTYSESSAPFLIVIMK